MRITLRIARIMLWAIVMHSFMPHCYAKGLATENITILENGVYFNVKVFAPFAEIILSNGKLISVSSTSSKMEGKRIALNGKFVIPGLIDAHVHVSGSPAIPYVIADSKLNANSSLLCGVTTMIDLFYPEDRCKEIKKETSTAPEKYSTLIMSGPILTAPGGHGTEYGVPTRTITSVAEATKITKEVIARGVDVIKLVYEADPSNYIPSLTIEMVAAIVKEAHAHNKKVFAHIDRANQAVACAEVGVDVIAHMPVDSLTDVQLLKLKSSGVVIIPTISVLESALDGHDAAYMSDSLLWKTTNPAYLDNFAHTALAKPPVSEEKLKKFYPEKKYMENLANCYKMKIPILAGTDAGNYAVFFGYSLHNDLLQYTRAGMTNAAALCTATQNICAVFPAAKIGKIAAGYDADLVVLDANPLENIENTKKINMVFHKGKLAKNIIPPPVINKNTTISTDKTVAFNPADIDISKASSLPGNIATFNDQKAGGTSEIEGKMMTAASGGNYLHLTGKVVKKGYIGFAGVSFGLVEKGTKTAADLSDYNAIEFDVKGNGEPYIFSLVSALVTDFNFHSAIITSAKDWQTVKISFSDVKQNAFYGKQVPLDLKTIRGISFTASGKDMNIDFDIRNVHLLKK